MVLRGISLLRRSRRKSPDATTGLVWCGLNADAGNSVARSARLSRGSVAANVHGTAPASGIDRPVDPVEPVAVAPLDRNALIAF